MSGNTDQPDWVATGAVEGHCKVKVRELKDLHVRGILKFDDRTAARVHGAVVHMQVSCWKTHNTLFNLLCYIKHIINKPKQERILDRLLKQKFSMWYIWAGQPFDTMPLMRTFTSTSKPVV